MKHTKVSGPTRSRSTSVVSSKSGTGRTSKTNENASAGPLRNAARTSRTGKSTSALAVSSHSNVQTSSSREAVTVKQETKIIGSIAEEGMVVDDVKPSRALEANGSGLTPSLGEMGVEVSSAIDVAEHQELGYDSEDDLGLRGEDADDVDDEEAAMVDDEDDWLALSEEQQIEVENTLTHVRETFDDEVDMYDTTMVAEYADDIFFYMSDLEVSCRSAPMCFRAHGILTGTRHAQPALHGVPERNPVVSQALIPNRRRADPCCRQGNANHLDRLVASSALALSHVARNIVDRRQHRRPVPLASCGFAHQVAACRRDSHVCRRQVRRNPCSQVRPVGSRRRNGSLIFPPIVLMNLST
jgi:hypothetical protein